jgi:hypothetical protein
MGYSAAPQNPNTVAPAGRPEPRNIVLAQGIQFTNADMAVKEAHGVLPDALTASVADKRGWRIVHTRAGDFVLMASLRPRAPLAINVTSSTTFEFASAAQNVNFSVTVVNTKDAFRTALLTANTHVVYDGHARYGRGPCFGILPAPGVVSHTEDWENGTNPTSTGIFRMGFPFIGVPVSEIFEHGYTADPTPSTVTVTTDQADRDLRRFVGALQAKTADDLAPGLISQLKDTDPTKTYWAYQAWLDGKLQWHVVINAGWTGTASAPSDLGATTPTCRVLCHFGCESFWHNHPILRRDAFKGWKRQGDDKQAYFTTNLSITGTSVYWLYHLFTYPKQNAWQDWGPSIDYAVRRTNADLAADRAGYQVI